jgi:hypothetical protein
MLFWWLQRSKNDAEQTLVEDRMLPENDEAMKEMRRRALLLGVGFDADDGHTRITRGKNFYLMGGSEPTHEAMQEKAIKFNEELKKRGRQIEQLSKREFYDIAERLDMGIVPHEQPKQ